MRFGIVNLAVLEWWAGQSPWLRLGIPIVLLFVLTGFYLFTGVIWLWGYVLGALLMLFSGRSESEKKGYHF